MIKKMEIIDKYTIKITIDKPHAVELAAYLKDKPDEDYILAINDGTQARMINIFD